MSRSERKYVYTVNENFGVLQKVGNPYQNSAGGEVWLRIVEGLGFRVRSSELGVAPDA